MLPSATLGPALGLSHSYQSLPAHFYSRLPPEPVSKPEMVLLNEPLAHALGWESDLLWRFGAQWFSGNLLPPDASPIALAYAGDQFGQFVPQLGDGRAILLGEVIDRQGRRQDVQLKGSGRTPYSRRGDGRAWLGPVLREYLVSEAMFALGVPTSRSLAVVTSGDPVFREQVLPGAVLTRVAASHIRVGTLQYFAARNDWPGVRQLLDYTLRRHYPEWQERDKPACSLLQAVIRQQAQLIARWLQVGFIHGVMNTDNTALSGETIDYGPCAFMDHYDPSTVFSSIDHWGRYAYGNQPAIAAWNMWRMAEALLPLLETEQPGKGKRIMQEMLALFPELLQENWLQGMRAKLGLSGKDPADAQLIERLLECMYRGRADYTLTLRRLAEVLLTGAEGEAAWCAGFRDPLAARRWLAEWLAVVRRDGPDDALRANAMNAVNPLYIPRNYLLENALSAAVEQGEWQPYRQLYQVLQTPFQQQEGQDTFSQPPPATWGEYQTFCGT
ncbi:MAG: YdiU family protein [Magnetococcales bacterium]|nr:YdiU family protein [Magnetococcales bacterium]